MRQKLAAPTAQIEETDAGQYIETAKRIAPLAGFVARADPENARGKEVASATKELSAKADQTLKAAIAAARMPKGLYKDADAPGLKARITASAASATPIPSRKRTR